MADVPATILELETLKGNPNAQAIFALPGSRGVSGIVQSDITINGQAMFHNPFEIGEDLSKKLTTTIAGLAGIAKRAGVYSKEIPSLLFQNVNQSAVVYVGSAKPKFSVDMTFVATQPGEDVRDPVARLLKAVYPTKHKGGILKTPFNYSPFAGSSKGWPTPRNTVSVQIGRWFLATKQVITDVSATFSKEVTQLKKLTLAEAQEGKESSNYPPLFVTVKVDFEPFRAITYGEVLGYMRVTQSRYKGSTSFTGFIE